MKTPFSPLVFAIRLIGYLPLWLTTRLVFALAWLSCWLPLSVHSARRSMLVNLMLAYPEKSSAELTVMARRAFAELAWTLVDCAHSWSRGASVSLARITRVQGQDALKDAMQSGRPVLLLSLHQSSWELPNLTVGTLGKVTVFYQPADDLALNALVTQAREGTGSSLVAANAQGVKAALAAMNRGEAVAILADHNPANAAGNPWVDFMGQPVRTSNLPYKLIKRYQPRVFFACARRVSGKVEAHFIEADFQADMDEQAVLGKVNDGLAAMINLAPTQYQWTYKRFYRTPEGRRPIYKKSALPIIRQALRTDQRDVLGLGVYTAETTAVLCEAARQNTRD